MVHGLACRLAAAMGTHVVQLPPMRRPVVLSACTAWNETLQHGCPPRSGLLCLSVQGLQRSERHGRHDELLHRLNPRLSWLAAL